MRFALVAAALLLAGCVTNGPIMKGGDGQCPEHPTHRVRIMAWNASTPVDAVLFVAAPAVQASLTCALGPPPWHEVVFQRDGEVVQVPRMAYGEIRVIERLPAVRLGVDWALADNGTLMIDVNGGRVTFENESVPVLRQERQADARHLEPFSWSRSFLVANDSREVQVPVVSTWNHGLRLYVEWQPEQRLRNETLKVEVTDANGTLAYEATFGASRPRDDVTLPAGVVGTWRVRFTLVAPDGPPPDGPLTAEASVQFRY